MSAVFTNQASVGVGGVMADTATTVFGSFFSGSGNEKNDDGQQKTQQKYCSTPSNTSNLPKVFLIRHAQSQTNSGIQDLRHSVFAYAWGDPSLSSRGHKEVATLRHIFHDWNTNRHLPMLWQNKSIRTSNPLEGDTEKMCEEESPKCQKEDEGKESLVSESDSGSESENSGESNTISTYWPFISSLMNRQPTSPTSALDKSTSSSRHPEDCTDEQMQELPDQKEQKTPRNTPPHPTKQNDTKLPNSDSFDTSSTPPINHLPNVLVPDHFSKNEMEEKIKEDISLVSPKPYVDLSQDEFLMVENVDVIVLSPLMRALETSNILFDLEHRVHLPHFPKCVVNPLCREAVHSRADLGSYRECLEEKFPHLTEAFRELPKSKWWYDSWGLPGIISYHENDISDRLQGFSDYLLQDEFRGKTMVIVGHSDFFRQFLGTKTKLRNCGVVQIRFNSTTGTWEPEVNSVFGHEQFYEEKTSL